MRCSLWHSTCCDHFTLSLRSICVSLVSELKRIAEWGTKSRASLSCGKLLYTKKRKKLQEENVHQYKLQHSCCWPSFCPAIPLWMVCCPVWRTPHQAAWPPTVVMMSALSAMLFGYSAFHLSRCREGLKCWVLVCFLFFDCLFVCLFLTFCRSSSLLTILLYLYS